MRRKDENPGHTEVGQFEHMMVSKFVSLSRSCDKMGMKRILNYMDGKFHCELLYAHGYRNRNVTRQEVLDEHYGKVIRKLEKRK